MTELNDMQLLRDYSLQGSEPAFARLVRRHVNLVYSVALRHAGIGALAEEITQAVFITLARKSATLRADTVLEGWLHETTRLTALSFLRGERRRQFREQEAYMQSQTPESTDASVWNRLAPALDEALSQLNQKDRDAVMLRYFKDKKLGDVAAAMNISEAAAQRRVLRAVEKLRTFFARRGVTLSAAALTSAIAANSVQSAPAGLASAATIAALSGAAATTAAALAASKTIAMTTLQKTLVTITIAALAGSGLYQARQAAQLREQNETLARRQELLADQLLKAQKEGETFSNRLAEAAASSKLSSEQFKELLQLRGKVTSSQNASDSPAEVAAKAWLARVSQLKRRLSQTPESNIPELQLLTEEDWLAAVKDRRLKTDADYRHALAALRSIAEDKFANKAESAVQKYSPANNGKFPSSLSQLQPYFDSPMDEAILQRWEIAPAKTVPSLGMGDPIITERAPVDELLDSRIAVGPNGYGSTDYLSSELQPTLKSLYSAFTTANKGQNPSDISELLPYATTPEQQAALQKMIQREQLNKQGN